jgi:hypothetical protein
VVARWFRISFAENAFRRHLAQTGDAVEELRVAGALAATTGFYAEARAQHTSIRDEGDGLLWQWGPDADATRFTVGVTRQLIREGDDEPIVQVTLCLAYRWTPSRRTLGRGHLWHFDPATVGDFTAAVRRSAGYRAVATAAPVDVTLTTDVL